MRDRRRGVVLAIVLVLILLLTTGLAAFGRRAVVDFVVVQNRDRAAQAEALARGGIRLAIAMLVEDLLRDQASASAVASGTPTASADGGQAEAPAGFDTLNDLWAHAGDSELETEDGGHLRVHIEDAGARLNLNSLVKHGDVAGVGGEQEVDPDVEEYLVEFITKVISDIDLPPAEKTWNPRQLAQNLIDYMDDDSIRVGGGPEDDYYLRQDPPYAAANRPLLSVDELRLVEGFDATLVEAMRPYVTVYPLLPGDPPQGVDLNTAPPWVLASVEHGPPGSRRLLDEDRIRQILALRDQGRFLCDDTAADPDRCVTPASVNIESSVYPPTVLPASASVFIVTADARVANVRRQVTAVVDRTDPQNPRLLSYRVE